MINELKKQTPCMKKKCIDIIKYVQNQNQKSKCGFKKTRLCVCKVAQTEVRYRNHNITLSVLYVQIYKVTL